MTREEAIKILQKRQRFCKVISDHANATIKADELQEVEAIDMAISALRPVSRETVERMWGGCPECRTRCGLCVNINAWDKYGKPDVCNLCVDCSNFESDQRFCDACGHPLTNEAVQIVMERLEALKDEAKD